MSERFSYSSHHPFEDSGSTSAPAWELLGHGTTTGPPDPLTGEIRPASGLSPWFNVRFTLADGSRVDVLAALLGGRAYVEELRAEPPLPPQALADLSAWIGASLEDASPAVPQPPPEGGTCPEGAAGPTVWTLGSCGFPRESAPVQEPPPTVAPQPVAPEPAAPAPGFPGPVGTLPVALCPTRSALPAEPPPAPRRLRRRARRVGKRGRAARRAAAEAYLAARARGDDPVLAVMCATGHSRRRSLRIIAGARDEGFLTPRHVRG